MYICMCMCACGTGDLPLVARALNDINWVEFHSTIMLQPVATTSKNELKRLLTLLFSI